MIKFTERETQVYRTELHKSKMLFCEIEGAKSSICLSWRHIIQLSKESSCFVTITDGEGEYHKLLPRALECIEIEEYNNLPNYVEYIIFKLKHNLWEEEWEEKYAVKARDFCGVMLDEDYDILCTDSRSMIFTKTVSKAILEIRMRPVVIKSDGKRSIEP